MKKSMLVVSMLVGFSAFGSPSKIPAKCETRAIQTLLHQGNNVCGKAHLDETNSKNVFLMTVSYAENTKPKVYSDEKCGYSEVDDGLPLVRFTVEYFEDGDCEIISIEDLGV